MVTAFRCRLLDRLEASATNRKAVTLELKNGRSNWAEISDVMTEHGEDYLLLAHDVLGCYIKMSDNDFLKQKIPSKIANDEILGGTNPT